MMEVGWRTRIGVLTDQRDGPLDFGRECAAQADPPRLIEQSGTGKLGLRLGMK